MDDFNLLLELIKIHLDGMAHSVIEKLKHLTDRDFLLSGDDSPLENVWEEVCTQVQMKRSIHWDSYGNTIENYIAAEYETQPDAIRYLLNCTVNFINNNFENQDTAYCDEDATIGEIKHKIMEEARIYRNTNIDLYLNN